MNPEELKKELEALGWRIERPVYDRYDGIGWVAYKVLAGFSDCDSNERPPALILTPYRLVNGADVFFSVELSITGRVNGDLWMKLMAYSVDMDDALKSIPKVSVLMRAAWNAAANLNTDGL